MSKAILPGSYDPITLGHAEIIKKAARDFDSVYVALMINPEKKYMFSSEDRVKMANLACAELANVEVIYDEGLLTDLFDKLGADVIVKGICNEADRAYEEGMARYNENANPRAKTLLVPCDLEYANISSSAVREAIKRKDRATLVGMLDARVIEYLESLI